MKLQIDPTDRVFDDATRTWVLLRLWMTAAEDGVVHASSRDMARTWKMSRNIVLATLRELDAGGWIETHLTAGQQSHYQLTGKGMVLGSRLTPAASSIKRDRVDKLTVTRSVPPTQKETDDTQPRKSQSSQTVPTTKKSKDLKKTPKPRKTRAATPSPDASRLVHQHADQYTLRFERPFAVAWGRDTQIYKRLVGTYGVELVERLQGQYLAQPLDSFAAKRGYSVPQFAAEIGGLATWESLRERLSPDQADVLSGLQTIGMAEETALGLVTEHPVAVIRDQLQVHRWRQEQGQATSPSRVERAVRERWVVPENARPVVYPVFPVGESAETEDPDSDTAVPAVFQALFDKIVVKV